MVKPLPRTTIASDFGRHAAAGLAAAQPYLSSRFIYDERGSRLFQEIMRLGEYYLTRAEYTTLEREAGAIAEALAAGGRPVDLIELGAGDGTKTKLLLAELLRRGTPLRYRPIDISGEILGVLGADLRTRFPALDFAPLVGTYLEALAALPPDTARKRVVLFLGSNLGNFPLAEAGDFLGAVTGGLAPADQLFLGVDLRKDPRRILRAYDDRGGVTARFNLNLLHRLRGELGAELDVGGWGFYPTYNPETGEVRSYLYPLGEQRIRIPTLGLDRVFGPHEAIHTEISRKYSPGELEALATACACATEATWLADEGFANVLWTRE